jgi:anti-sigma factor RsiW
MSCSSFDLKAYFLKELPGPQALQMEEHLRQCAACGEELDRLRLTEAALLALPEEEAPHSIRFLPAPARPRGARRPAWGGWFGAFWESAPRLGFASACVLAAAIVFYAVSRPAHGPGPAAPPPTVAAVSNAEIGRQIQAAVDKAVRDVEASEAKKVEILIANHLKREEEDRQQLALATAELDYREWENGGLRMASYRKSAGPGDRP